MEIETFRISKKMNRYQFVKKIEPFLSCSLDEFLLERIEKGEITRSDRIEEVIYAINKAFPDSKTSLTKEFVPSWKQKLTLKLGIFILVILCVIAILVVFVLYENHPWVESIVKALGLTATIATILGFILVIPSSKSK